jgi:hypothetical protein
MKPLWDPVPFARVLKSPPTPQRQRAYEALQKLLQGIDHYDRRLRKSFEEWEVFLLFCNAEGLQVDPATVEMLDPNPSRPSPPDLRCNLNGKPHYFELVEILQSAIAEYHAHLFPAPSSSKPTPVPVVVPSDVAGKVIQPRFSMAEVWETFYSAIAKKCGKSYAKNARPISLLLYFHRVDSFWQLLEPLVGEKRVDLKALLKNSEFDAIWVFDANAHRVLWTLRLDELAAI